MLKNEKAFTLLEMLIVLMIITVLILLVIPNVATRSTEVHEKGCQALVVAVQAQVDAYALDEGSPPVTLKFLKEKKYITEDQMNCKNGKSLKLDANIVVANSDE